MSGIITLITDFGCADAYVAAMKGVILSINPQAVIVDISHEIEPQNIIQAAFVIGSTYSYFPPETIHVIVIDPGVGTQRNVIILQTPGELFIAPDNGVLSYIIQPYYEGAHIRLTPQKPHFSIEEKRLPFPLRAIALTSPEFWCQPVSRTFHGRDIFAPIAARLSLGVPWEKFGDFVDTLQLFQPPQPYLDSEKRLVGCILHIDHFGNLITNIRECDLPQNELHLCISGRRIDELSFSYDEGSEILALIGSSGNLEIAARNSSAARVLGMTVGDKIKFG